MIEKNKGSEMNRHPHFFIYYLIQRESQPGKYTVISSDMIYLFSGILALITASILCLRAYSLFLFLRALSQ